MDQTQANRTHFVACNLCEAICGLEIRIENNQIRSIKGDKADPISKGHICPKAVALQDIYNDPDRLRTPSKKTAGGWQEISWEQAYDEVSRKLKTIGRKHGKDAVAVYLGNPTVHNMEALMYGPMFFRTLRTKNRYSATSVDQLPEQLVSLLMFGHSLLIPLPDIDRTGFHIIFGANPLVSNGSLMTAPGIGKRLRGIRERGGKLVVVDPRKTETAGIADKHLFIKPGTDVFMLLAMLNTVFDEKLETLGAVEDFTIGLETIRDLVRGYTAEMAEAQTGVSAGDIRELVREFCRAPSASCYGRIGVSTQRYGSLTQWLITVFNIVTGNLDVPGGTMFSTPALDILNPPAKGKKGFADNFTRVRKLPNFVGEFPVAALSEEILTPGDGQIRALITYSGNPVLSTPNGRQLDTALGELDFMVSIDIYLNETTRHADIILPPVMGLERPHYDLAFQALAIRNGARYSQPVFKPGRQQRTDKQIFTELAWRMQSGNLFAKMTGWVKKLFIQAMKSDWIINKRLKSGPYGQSHGLNMKQLTKHPHGIDLGAMRPSLPERLFTPDKSIRLCPDEFVEHLKSVLETRPGLANPAEGSDFDLQLIGRRDPRSNNSWLHNSQRLVKGKNRCVALVHPDDARVRKLEDGDIAKVTSRVGSLAIPIHLSTEMMPGVISIPHGWGHDAAGIGLGIASRHAGVNANILTDEHFLDSVSANAALNGVPVSLKALAQTKSDGVGYQEVSTSSNST